MTENLNQINELMNKDKNWEEIINQPKEKEIKLAAFKILFAQFYTKGIFNRKKYIEADFNRVLNNKEILHLKKNRRVKQLIQLIQETNKL